jgi:signal transduction histidine kinase
VRQSRLLKLPAIATWAVCGLPPIVSLAFDPAPGHVAVSWAVAFALYGITLFAGMWYRDTARGVASVLLVLQTVAAIVAAHFTVTYLDASGVGMLTGIGLLVIVSAELPRLLGRAAATTWIVAQTLAVTLAVSARLNVADAVTFAVGAAGFQGFAMLTTALMLREADARADLARANAELHATRSLLAESSRARERLRIARDLHDSLGHHLTALNLQLDVASRLPAHGAGAHVAQAHAITKLLLAEVRTVVGQLRDRGEIDVVASIRQAAAAADGLTIHLDVPERLALGRDHDELLLRSVQEIITNTARHSGAENLWITIRPDSAGVNLHARDDGRGVRALRTGNGLTGMRERFAELSGSVTFESPAGKGFEIRGFVPAGSVAS